MKKKASIVLIILLIIISFAAGFQTARIIEKKSEPKVSVTMIQEALQDCSELTTAVLSYKGLVKYSDGNISYINKKSFSMVYCAQIKAGIDLSQAQITMTSSQVKVTLPETQILSTEVDTDNLEFYDESFALFNWTKKEDTAAAVKMAKEDVAQNADLTNLKEHAKEQAKVVIKGFVSPMLSEGMELVIE